MKKIQAHLKHAHRVIDGHAYIVDNESSLLHELNDTGTYIWGLIKKPCAADELARRISDEFDVSSDQAADDVNEFISTMSSKNLIEVKE